ncbi:ABC transporter permease [Xylanimonas oleitrophica]|uniref:ABC transporter permease n=1 Tax=Xylanimonas oleitrophica TaxID=2607479 RepID=A0A2W5WWG0_9MICO|nr:ABC transporter permease [Xylanimonas oleitrophica]PZR54972.1 ABC transporter permease [Xylanimonas oleitrophica]
MSGLVGAVVEAWDELRIHKVRVLLALVGVAVAVTAITGITAAVSMLGQAMQESSDRDQGRPTTLTVYGWNSTGELDPLAFDQAVDELAERYKISYHSVQANQQLPVRSGASDTYVQLTVVDPSYSVITRLVTDGGRWFTDRDAEALGPTLVVNQPFLDQLTDGRPVDAHPQVTLGGDTAVQATVIGTVPVRWEQEGPMAYMLFDQAARWLPDLVRDQQYKIWVPTELDEDLQAVLRRDLTAMLPGMHAEVQLPWDSGFGLDSATRWVVLGVSGFALLLGGLGLLNIALVTVRYRIREIGIRRSFGATGSRVFFGVLMESVVATFVAGLVGVVLAVAIVKNIPVERVFGTALQDTPPFPFTAALVGMACATGVGALAGLVPAIYAVRVKVIDAIRY